jgi:hypothetical protein
MLRRQQQLLKASIWIDFLIFAPDVDHLVWCEPDVKMSKLDNDGKAMISMYLSILIAEINIYSGRN